MVQDKSKIEMWSLGKYLDFDPRVQLNVLMESGTNFGHFA
jgi:hypothetical protein